MVRALRNAATAAYNSSQSDFWDALHELQNPDKISGMWRWAWLASLAIGCGHAGTPVAAGVGSQAAPRPDAALPLEEDLPRLAQRMAKMYRDWQQAFAAAGTDCA